MRIVLRKVLGVIERAEVFLSVLFLGAMILITGVQVLARYGFGSPFSWPEEVCTLLLIYTSFITGDIVYKKKGHISIDTLVAFFPARMRAASELLLNLCICVVLLVIIQRSVPLMEIQWGHTTAAALTLPKSFWTLPVPLVFASMFLTTLDFALDAAAEYREAAS